MYQALLVIHVLVALGIIGLVLIQQGRGADAGAAFGSGSSGTVFGARGAASFLTRSTAILAAAFFASSLALAYLLDNRGEEGTDIMDIEAPVVVPAAPDVPQVNDAAEPGISESDLPAMPSVPAQSRESFDVPAIEGTAMQENIQKGVNTVTQGVESALDAASQQTQESVQAVQDAANQLKGQVDETVDHAPAAPQNSN